MITIADLKTQTKADLAKLAKRLGVAGFGSMRKEDLLVAVAKASKVAKNKTPNRIASSNKPSASKLQGKKGTTTKGVASEKTAKPFNGHKAAVKKGTTAANRSASDKQSALKTTARGVASAMKPAPSKVPVKNLSKSTPSSKSSPVQPANRKKDEDLSRLTSAKASNEGSSASKAAAKNATKSKEKSKPVPPPTDPKVLKRIRELQQQRQSDKDIAFRPTLIRPPGALEPVWEKEPVKDRVVLFVRDAHWMHASWDITRNAIDRAKAAMMEQWHGAKPVLRLIRMDDTGTSTTSETVERDIEIHGGSRNWYIEWNGEPASFRVLIGYLALNGRFHAMSKSNIVKTPGAGSPDVVDEHWTDLAAQSEHIYAISGGYDNELETGELKEMLEERLHRTLGAPPLAKLGAGVDSPFRRRGGFHFDMEVELIVYGATVSDGYLTLNGEPVKLRPDGSFAMRVPFPDRRQVLPAVACSRDGSQQRTIVVAVERNTKIMEPLESEQDTGE